MCQPKFWWYMLTNNGKKKCSMTRAAVDLSFIWISVFLNFSANYVNSILSNWKSYTKQKYSLVTKFWSCQHIWPQSQSMSQRTSFISTSTSDKFSIFWKIFSLDSQNCSNDILGVCMKILISFQHQVRDHCFK